jgi:predicted O-methyltransferase YrrM
MMPTKEDYERIFEEERLIPYPTISGFEEHVGYAVSRLRLEPAARVLACPIKVNRPNWAHGRVIYATLRRYLAEKGFEHFTLLDVGTAKGFSALCMVWALMDSARRGSIFSVDVIDPKARVRRNTIAEVDGLKTLPEILEPWPEAAHVSFLQSGGADWLASTKGRIHFAFVDGKHDFKHVAREAELLMARQQAGDIIIFDDVQIVGVAEAVDTLLGIYDLLPLAAKPERRYCIAVKR